MKQKLRLTAMFWPILTTMCLEARAQQQETFAVTGKVISAADGRALAGATVSFEDKSTITVTNSQGEFRLTAGNHTLLLVISYTGYEMQTVPISQMNTTLTIRMKPSQGSLDEVIVIGYGQTNKRINTSSVGIVGAREIERQPVTNALSALSGRVAGVLVQTTNGLPGGNINIQIRGQGSMVAGNAPLYVIDGVPFDNDPVEMGTGRLANGSMAGAQSPLNLINPNDIEQISILKDADATSIYGSRGSNGVVLITTKNGSAGIVTAALNLQQGLSQAASLPNLLSLGEYLQIRRQAFANDEVEPSADPMSPYYAPDLMVWDTTQSADWAKLLYGNIGYHTVASARISGGSDQYVFNINGNVRTESTFLIGDDRYWRGGATSQFQQLSKNKRFLVQIRNIISFDNADIANPVNVISFGYLRPPNQPIFDAQGNYNWEDGDNPLAAAEARSKTKTMLYNGNLLLQYTLGRGLVAKSTIGYNRQTPKHIRSFPSRSLYPGSSSYAYFGDQYNQTFIVEPQLAYSWSIGTSRLDALLGGTYQDRMAEGTTMEVGNFSHDGLLEDPASGTVDALNTTYKHYRYVSVFGRLTYNYKDTYIINGTLRRDGSSKFGHENRFGLFGSLGAGWIFSNESWFKDAFPAISFGKIRASYGTTGNDQIPDYEYLSLYRSGGAPYQDVIGLGPARIANARFHWETTKKTEVAVELALFNNRVQASAARYVNKSEDQLIGYAVPNITGFSSYQANLPAEIENSGWEWDMTLVPIRSSALTWNLNINLSLPKNKLNSFQGFETSPYVNLYELGYDISRAYGYELLDIDKDTGKAIYADQDGNPSNIPYLFATLGKLSPDYFGGVGTDISFGRWQVNLFGQFVRQRTKGGIFYTPGFQMNSFSAVLDYPERFPRPSRTLDTRYGSSSANMVDASYFRLKNVSLAYSIPKGSNTPYRNMTVFVQGQNVFTAWDKGSMLLDPESGALGSGMRGLPPVKTWIVGVDINF